MEASKKNEIVIKRANDHWAFLEHIEAPMWADLTLEANSGGEDISDHWFNISHPFHQWSACQLKAKFSHPGEEILTSEVVESPQLPSSVSRSRGKHYNSKKGGGMNLNILLDKQQGLSKRCFQAGSSFGQEVKTKPKSNVGRPKGPPSSAKLGLNFKRNARGNAKSMASCSNSVSRSSSMDNKAGESSTRSTVTSENTQQQQKYMEVSSQTYGQKSKSLTDRRCVGLRKSCITNTASRVQQQQKFMEVSSQPCDQKSGSSCSSVLSVSLGKSCITKNASRVEIGGDSIQSRGRKSSSGNSSVGSSSVPGYEVKFVSKHLREKISDGNNTVTINLADKSKWKPTNVSQKSTNLVEGEKLSNKKGNIINLGRPVYHRTTKSLAQYQSIRSRALLPGKVNKKNSCTGTKEKLGKVYSVAGKGKENAAKNVTLNPKCTERGVPDGGMFKSHRTTECNHLQKGETARSAALTKLGKNNNQCEAMDSARRVFL